MLAPTAAEAAPATAPAAAKAAAAAPARVLFRIADPRIAEASGIATGLASPGIVYVHNDSGDTNRFFALDPRTGATVATVRVTGATNVDWEDIAVARDARGTPSVWLADIGDNDAVRDEVRVYRVDEPKLRASARGLTIRSERADVWRLRYPGGPVNAEALAVSPSGVGYIVTKSYAGDATVYRLPPHADPARVQVLHRIASVRFGPTGTRNPFGAAGGLPVTAAAISRDGSLFTARSYSDAHVWRMKHANVAEALKGKATVIALPDQELGEGIDFDGRRLLVDSEGIHSAVYAVPLGQRAPTSAPPPRVPASPTDPSKSGGLSGNGRTLGLLLAVALVGVAVVGFAVRWPSRRGSSGRRRSG